MTWHPKGNGLSIILPGSKTSQGNPQVLLVTDPQLVRLVRRWLHPRSEEMLWPKGPHLFRQAFSMFLEYLGFAASDYTPYCLRRGGATWHFQATLSLDCTVTRGRWSCTKTARAYIDEGTAQLAHVSWSRAQRKKVDKWSRYLSKVRLRQEREIGASFFLVVGKRGS